MTPEQKKEYNRQYYAKNKERLRKHQKEYREENKEELSKKQKEWRQNNKEHQTKYFREYARNKRSNDLNYKIKNNLRLRIRQSINNNTKSKRTKELLGCSIEYLKQYLFEQFQDGMSWDNYGEWHIDHIRPCASFDLSDPKQQEECFHYTNLQPLWAIDNLKKQDKW